MRRKISMAVLTATMTMTMAGFAMTVNADCVNVKNNGTAYNMEKCLEDAENCNSKICNIGICNTYSCDEHVDYGMPRLQYGFFQINNCFEKNFGFIFTGCGNSNIFDKNEKETEQITEEKTQEYETTRYESQTKPVGNNQCTIEPTTNLTKPELKPQPTSNFGNTESEPTTGPTQNNRPTTRPTTKPENTTSNVEQTTKEVQDDLENAYAQQVVNIVNKERQKAGLNPVTLDKNIEKAALVRAKETEKLFSHTRPDGRNFSTVLTDYNIKFSGAGENIAWGQQSPEEVMNAWMNSSGHRANILNAKFTKIGVGYYINAGGKKYWTQLFTY